MTVVYKARSQHTQNCMTIRTFSYCITDKISMPKMERGTLVSGLLLLVIVFRDIDQKGKCYPCKDK